MPSPSKALLGVERPGWGLSLLFTGPRRGESPARGFMEYWDDIEHRRPLNAKQRRAIKRAIKWMKSRPIPGCTVFMGQWHADSLMAGATKLWIQQGDRK